MASDRPNVSFRQQLRTYHRTSLGLQCANSRPEQVQQTEQAYSITSSARSKKDSETFSLRALAVVISITSSNFVGCSTGRSAGLARFILFCVLLARGRSN